MGESPGESRQELREQIEGCGGKLAEGVAWRGGVDFSSRGGARLWEEGVEKLFHGCGSFCNWVGWVG